MEVPGRLATLLCTLCKYDGHKQEVKGYCKDCREFLCSPCVLNHRRIRITRQHVILTGNDIPKAHQDTAHEEANDEDCPDMCEIHPDRRIEYYCLDHLSLGCGPCIIDKHRSCNIENISVVSKCFKYKAEYQRFLSKVEDTGNKLDTLETKFQDDRLASNALTQSLHESIRSYRHELDSFLDGQERDLLHNVNRFEKENGTRLKHDEERTSEIREDWKQRKRLVQQNDNPLKHLYILTKRYSDDVASFNKECEAMMRAQLVQPYTFIPSETLQTMILSGKGIGQFQTSNIHPSSKVSMQSEVEKKEPHKDQRSICIQHELDKSDPYVLGLALVDDNSLVVVDSCNNALKLIDIHSKKISCFLQMSTMVWDVTCLHNKQIAVTLPDKSMIQFLSTSHGLIKLNKVAVTGNCYGICYSEDKLLVSYRDPGRLELLNLDGSVCKAVDSGMGKQIQTTYVTASSYDNHPRIYVSHTEQNVIQKMQHKEERGFTLKDQMLASPVGLVSIRGNCLAVCCHTDKKILLIADALNGMTIVQRLECVKEPAAIEFSPSSNCLIVSSLDEHDCRYIHMYPLK